MNAQVREQRSTIATADTTIHVRDVGPLDAPTVVLLHGITGHCLEWDDMVTRLASTCRVIVPDQRGHGCSGRVPSYRIVDMVDDLVAVMDHLDVPAAHVVGHSLGGMVAMTAAASHPGRVQGLVVIDIGPTSFDSEFAAGLPGLLDMLGSASYTTVDHAVDEWMTMNPAALEAPIRRFVEHGLQQRPDGRWAWMFDGPGLSRSALSLTTTDVLWDAVDRVAAPTLLIRGRQSPVLDRTTADEMIERFASASLVEVGGGHDLAVECPADVGRLVGAFLAATGALDRSR
jgi:esterase